MTERAPTGTPDPRTLAFCAHRDPTSAEELLRAHPEAISAVTEHTRETALIWATIEQWEGAVHLLIAHGADLNARDHADCTALIYAVRVGAEGLVATLLASGADVNAKDRLGQSPLLEAVEGQRVGLCRTLLKAGARPDITDFGDIPALPKAAEQGVWEIVRLLLEHGASPAMPPSPVPARPLSRSPRPGAMWTSPNGSGSGWRRGAESHLNL